MKTADVVIIGGGGIGLSILYYLLKSGCKDVILFEKGVLAAESTGKSAGGFRQQFSTEINIKMSKLSIEKFKTLNEELNIQTVFNHKGYIFLAGDKQQFNLYRKNVKLQQSLGIDVDLISLDELEDLVPGIRIDDLVGATFCPSDGFTDPYEVAMGYAKKSREMGGQIIHNAEVNSINIKKGIITGVNTYWDTISTPIVINAAGPWASEVGKMAKLDLPIKPYKRQIFTSAPFKPFTEKGYKMPMVVDKTGLYMRSEGETILMGMADKDESPSFNQNIEWSFLEQIVEPAMNRIPIFENLEIHDGWAGLYDTTPDHHAIIGESPELKGFINAAGFSGHGFMHSPATGIVISELIMDGKARSVDISSLSISRFDNGGKGIEEVSVI